MRSTQYSQSRETIIAEHIAEVVTDLRLVDAADYIAFIRCELFANIADIVNSATELYFYPSTLTFGQGADYRLDWNTPPTIVLDMEFRNQGVSAYFRLTLADNVFEVDLNHVAFDKADPSPDTNTERLRLALIDSRLQKR